MQPRFVVIPAVPKEKPCPQHGIQFYTGAVCSGFNLYDNVEKLRLQLTFNQRAEAEAECSRLNVSAPG